MAIVTKNLGIVSPVPADEWNASTTYQKLNIVSHNDSVYIAKQGSTGIEPGVTTNWQTSWMFLVSSTGGGGSDVEVVQITGQSETAVMSQKAVTDELNGKASTSYVQGNPTENGTVDLTKLKVDNTVYNIPQGGGGSGGDFDPTKYYTKTETDGLLNEKQDDLTQTQLNAVNSGITATKVSTYDGYATAINNKVDKVTGKGLSTNDFTTAEKTKLAGIEYVKANPTESGTANLTKLKVGNIVYNVPQGGGGGGTTVVANPTLTGSETNLSGLQVGNTKYGIKALKVTIW